MTFAYVAAVFCIASTPVAIGLGLAAWDDHRKRQQARRDFYLISERELMCRALASSPRLRLPVEEGPAVRAAWVAGGGAKSTTVGLGLVARQARSTVVQLDT